MKFLFQKFSPLKKVSFFILFFISLISLQSYASVDEKMMIKESKIVWEGSKVTGSHEGTVNLKSGFLVFKNGGLVGGEFVLDMTSIVCTDLSGKGKASLENHLKNADFFDVNNYPTAELIILGAEKGGAEQEYTIKAEITIKEITQKIAFKAKIERKKARARLVIDRTLFGIIYKSGNFFKGLADKAIYDEFKIGIDLVF